jgi:nucleoside-diphosphate-sugar epimerase
LLPTHYFIFVIANTYLEDLSPAQRDDEPDQLIHTQYKTTFFNIHCNNFYFATMAATTGAIKRLLVLGGNGYVGQYICHAAAASGKFTVKSLSRSGKPSKLAVTHLQQGLENVEWLEGDIFDKARRKETFEGVDYIVSTIGAFGSNEFMENICGDATVQAVETAVAANVSRFAFVSSAQVGKFDLSNSQRFPLHGYYKGKTKAEDAIRAAFPNAHVILRPGFIYGQRPTPIATLPLQLIGVPVDFVSTKLGPISSLIQAIPFVGTECANMVPVHGLAQAVVQSLLSEEPSEGKTLLAEDIRKFAN